ncbi:MAG: Cell envelope-related transcriptional attenuator [Candidatus Gottesmanbacteria bacterium GW2011_GWA2_41_12]|uniref:Cell envelope-related transcriptional attenuator n=1 Tax=Candidatus Gottesmanbacteria bacterium GW2011_GWA2_41_12 TaxID=1618440 RepID=A0A0G0UM84_9BACT|nr:MAG: Cell envelope-related transcriptional attenuator [Candidatus Gottesmanbacteria bacterium GW2011_GWA2_41_12]
MTRKNLPRLSQMLHKRKFLKFLPLFRTAIVSVVVLVLVFYLLQLLSKMNKFLTDNNINKNTVAEFMGKKDGTLKSSNGRVNIVVLGVGGGDHEGPDLTDSMMMLSIDIIRNTADMISIPRDLWLTSIKGRINTAYTIGEEKKKGGGLILAKASIEEVIGQPVHYGLLIDFSGFRKLVDTVGGVDLKVEEAFDDADYPIPGKEKDDCGKKITPEEMAEEANHETFPCRFQLVHFDIGQQNMNGEQALKFVRSRHATGDEGTDFARSKRQQKVMIALKDKILHSNFLDLNKMKSTFKAFDDATDTDMTLGEMMVLGKYALNINNSSIRKINLEMEDKIEGKKGFLLNPPVDKFGGAWVLIPRKGEDNFQEIHTFINCKFSDPNCGLNP